MLTLFLKDGLSERIVKTLLLLRKNKSIFKNFLFFVSANFDTNSNLSRYMLDPKEFPGLAHFCEHMLFMGSEKYPVENVFSKFIEDHAGSTNAYTSNENTNYHFEIATSHFKEALDMYV